MVFLFWIKRKYDRISVESIFIQITIYAEGMLVSVPPPPKKNIFF